MRTRKDVSIKVFLLSSETIWRNGYNTIGMPKCRCKLESGGWHGEIVWEFHNCLKDSSSTIAIIHRVRNSLIRQQS
jgi:hypothetical protein